MKRIRVSKLYSQTHYLAKKFGYIHSSRHPSVRQFSNGSKFLPQKFFPPLQQHVSMNNGSFNGVIKSTYPDIEKFSSDYTIDKYVWENLDQWPDLIAVECVITGQKYTFSQLRILSKKFAVSLQKRGYKSGQVISIVLPNTPNYVISVVGSMEAGLIVSPINPVYTPHELSHQLHNSGTLVVVTLSDYVTKLREAIELIKNTHKINYELDIIVVNDNRSVSIPEGVTNFEEMISDQVDSMQLMQNNRSIDDIAVLPYSSGTTGLSKGVQLTHRNCISNSCQIDTPDTHHFYRTSSNYQETMPAILPFFHIYGLSVIMIRSLRYGVKLVTMPKFEVAPFLTILKDHRATVLYVAPPILLFLGNNPHVTNEHVASLRVIVNGAGPISETDADRVWNRFQSNFVINQGYGLTETSPVVCLASQQESDVISVGKPIRSTCVKIIKPDGSLALAKEYGEICVKGPQVMLGYHNNQTATKEAIDDEKYFHTGDIGYYDESGKFYVVDRLKELIKVRGFQVPPAELEGILRAHKEVLDAAVIGIPDKKSGEKPLAFVVTRNKDDIRAAELMDFVSSKVAPYKRLANVVFVDSIPRSQAGKILRRILKEKFSATS